jgi:SAM-dependent methyltransferase
LTETFVDLGAMPLANSFITANEIAGERRYPLHVRVCPSCLLVQADHSVPPDAIFSADYAYFSSYADTWVEHARQYADAIIERYTLGPGSLVVEIASNDGYLLQHFKNRGVPVLGVEPAANVADAARAKGIPTEVTFFGRASAARLAAAGHRADLMAANNVLAHVPDIRDFVGGFALLLKPEGVVTFEFPHLFNLIRQTQFDTIYHEHYSYLSLFTVEHILEAAGLKAIDVEELPTHGGSLRLYAAKRTSTHAESARLDEVRNKEREAHLDRPEGYRGFSDRVQAARASFLSFLANARRQGKRVAAYGAAAKGNTFLNYCGVTASDVACVFDRSVAKQGKLSPGSHIPVLAPQKLADVKPDFLIILPWNLADEVQRTNAALRTWGGRFVIGIPQTRVLP